MNIKEILHSNKLNRVTFYAVLFGMASLIMPLTACSEKEAEQATITSEASLGVLETAAYQYEQGDFGTPDASAVAEMKALDQQAYTAIVKIRTAAQNGDTITTAEQVAATTAVAAFQAYLVQKNIVTSTK